MPRVLHFSAIHYYSEAAGEVGTMVETERAEESESSGETASRERPNMQNMGISLNQSGHWNKDGAGCY